ncbi:MAG: hypothetical protein ABWW66_00490 [Archaeoglobaceae archaeon]
MRKLALILTLLLIFAPASALEHLTKDNFELETSVTPEKSYYYPGETISATYKIMPASSDPDDMELIGGERDNPRTYTFSTELEQAEWLITVHYYKGSLAEEFSGRKVEVEVKYFYIDEQQKGVRYIEVNVTGKLPEVEERLEDVIVVNASVEDCEPDALQPLKVKVVNEAKFSEDIGSLRSKAEELKSELDEAGVKYNQSDFDEVFDLLSDAESLAADRKFLEADEKIREAESKLSEIEAKADELKARTLLEELEDLMDNLYYNLTALEFSLKKAEGSGNYTNYVSLYAEYKSEYDSIKSKFDDAKELYEDGKYSDAYEALGEVKPEAEQLLKNIQNLISRIESEGESFKFPGLAIPSLQIDPLYLVVAAAAAVIIAAIIFRRRRGRWDELR